MQRFIGARVEGDKVIVMAKGGNEGARQLCGELLAEKPMRMLGYAREEMLEACRSAEQGMSLTVVPVAPKSGRWVPIYVEGEK